MFFRAAVNGVVGTVVFVLRTTCDGFGAGAVGTWVLADSSTSIGERAAVGDWDSSGARAADSRAAAYWDVSSIDAQHIIRAGIGSRVERGKRVNSLSRNVSVSASDCVIIRFEASAAANVGKNNFSEL